MALLRSRHPLARLSLTLSLLLGCPIEIVEGDLAATPAAAETDTGELVSAPPLDERLRWRVVHDQLGDTDTTSGRALAILHDGNIAFVARADDGSRDHLGVLTPTGELVWARASPLTASSIAASDDGRLAVAGDTGERATLALYLADGARLWATSAECMLSAHVDVQFGPEDGQVAAVGECEDGYVSAYALADGAHQLTRHAVLFARFEALTRAPDGHLRALAREVDGGVRVVDFSPELIARWSSEPLHSRPGAPVDLATDDAGDSYVLGVDAGWLPYVTKLERDQLAWTRSLRPGRRTALAVAPGSAGVVIVGSEGPDAVVEWLDGDGVLVDRLVLAGADDERGAEWLNDVALAPSGDVVAIGGQRGADGDTNLLVVALRP